MASDDLAARLQERIARSGPISVADYIAAALYDPAAGFYATTGRAGRRGDFLTSPEVGPLFGAVVARALDGWWIAAGRPSRFRVDEWGAGPGTLGRAIAAAEPEALTSGALRWQMLERSAAQRELHPAVDGLVSVDPAELDPTEPPDVVFANELLDNLPFDIVERAEAGWARMLIDAPDGSERFALVVEATPLDPHPLLGVLPDAPLGTRLPVQNAAHAWIAAARRAARVVVFDYGASSAELAGRGMGWLRTHRDHDDTADWLVAPGTCDITTDVAFDQLQVNQPADRVITQATWLREHGIAALVEEGRAIWAASAGVGDLAALKARSRVRESEALLDPSGLGSFRVFVWTQGDRISR